MRQLIVFISVIILFVCGLHASPLDNKDTNNNSKSAFGQAFDEIVVESHLTVRRKGNGRQGRTQNETNEAGVGIVKTKREIKFPVHSPQTIHLARPKHLQSSAANAQSQAFNSAGPLGSFGASASGSQFQNFETNPNGLSSNFGFSGTQQYNFNGKTIDIAFGSAFSNDGRNNNAGSAVTITGPDGRKRPLNG